MYSIYLQSAVAGAIAHRCYATAGDVSVALAIAFFSIGQMCSPFFTNLATQLFVCIYHEIDF
ncbi:hypothetical protein NDI49_08050 [Trichocoleus sp. ST-U3]|uniref:hypothetical protein n=1 Tax=Coleofasciculus sp. FACHB-542 TaxID=2692787 RepID=UPI001682C6F8|nr:hypothetical protein [Coleofasciculus sp. FACHB-542]MBD2084095.1 hypothetical protein [Coleofasciculus sp. FACHB-542]